MQQTKLGIIGGGNLATALISGLTKSKILTNTIHVCDHHKEKLTTLQQQYNIIPHGQITTLLENTNTIILAVKPQSLKTLCQQITPKPNQTYPLIISVAAGIETTTIENWLNIPCAIIRAMPNTPAQIQQGITGLYANQHTTEIQRQTCTDIFKAVGKNPMARNGNPN